MPHLAIILFSYVIIIAAIIGIVRYKYIDKTFLPFILLLCVGAVNEILSTILTYTIRSTVVNNNIYVLAEALLILWQFRLWRVFEGKITLYFVTGFVIVTAWIIECFILPGLQHVSTVCSILYAFIIVLMAMSKIARMVIEGSLGLASNSIIMICTGFCIFFTYKIIVECFWLYGFQTNRTLTIQIFDIMVWINLFVNILFCFATLWIPRKPKFITYS